MPFEFEKLIVFDRALDAAEAADVLVPGHALPAAGDEGPGRAFGGLVRAEYRGGVRRVYPAGEGALLSHCAKIVCETAGALKLAVRYRIFSHSRIEHAMKLLDETAAMLTTMSNKLVAQARREGNVRKQQQAPDTSGKRRKKQTLAASAGARPAR